MLTEPTTLRSRSRRPRATRWQLAAWTLLLGLTVAMPSRAQRRDYDEDSLDSRSHNGTGNARPTMRFAPPLDGPRFDVQSVDARTLVISRARSEAAGLEGFLVDVPSLVATLEQRVLTERGLDGIARLTRAASSSQVSQRAHDDARDFRYPYQFSAPFSAVSAELWLKALDDSREETWLVVLATLLGAFMLAGLFALYRMVAVQVHFAQRRENFVSAVSHELKTPLTAIRMYGELLRDGLVDGDATRQEYYGLITAESERLSRLVENVLRLAQIERQKAPPRRALARPRPAIMAALDLLRPRAQALGFTLCVDIDETLPAVEFDADGLTQVLFNLIDNALKYARDASDKRIDVRGTADSDGLRLCVRDRGPGVPASELARLGEPFYRAGSELTRRHEGVGLGLSLVRRIAADMRGRVECKNASPGFEVTLWLRGER